MADLPLIQGKKPDSEIEVWVAQSLYKNKEPFVFQFYVGTGDVRGDLIVDFLLLRFETPLEVFGDYWHESELPGGDVLRIVRLKEEFGQDPLILWESDAGSFNEVDRWVRSNVLV